jgi:ABC-type transport system involved in cytochrome c biogenesis permease subunit
MQLTKENIYNRCVVGIAALIWVFGLMAAGSDSIYMPWLNLAGAIVFLLVSIWLGRVLPRFEASGRKVLPRVSVRTAGIAPPFVKKHSGRANTRYAGGWSTV